MSKKPSRLINAINYADSKNTNSAQRRPNAPIPLAQRRILAQPQPQHYQPQPQHYQLQPRHYQLQPQHYQAQHNYNMSKIIAEHLASMSTEELTKAFAILNDSKGSALEETYCSRKGYTKLRNPQSPKSFKYSSNTPYPHAPPSSRASPTFRKSASQSSRAYQPPKKTITPTVLKVKSAYPKSHLVGYA